MPFFKLDNVELRWTDPCAVLGCKTELPVFRHELGARSKQLDWRCDVAKMVKKSLALKPPEETKRQFIAQVTNPQVFVNAS